VRACVTHAHTRTQRNKAPPNNAATRNQSRYQQRRGNEKTRSREIIVQKAMYNLHVLSVFPTPSIYRRHTFAIVNFVNPPGHEEVKATIEAKIWFCVSHGNKANTLS